MMSRSKQAIFSLITLCGVVLALSTVFVTSGNALAQVDENENRDFDIRVYARDNEQTVEPTLALDTFGSSAGASAWVERVRAHPKYNDGSIRGDGLCRRSIQNLYKHICDGNAYCSIEERYRTKCIEPSPGTEAAKKCIAVVDSYVDNCFGDECSPLGGVVDALEFVVSLQSGGKCTGTVIHKGDWPKEVWDRPHELLDSSFAPITAAHCKPQTQDTLARGLEGIVTGIFTKSELAAVPDKVTLMDIRVTNATKPDRWALRIAPPTEFAETIFVGLNVLLEMRNEVVKKLSLAGYTSRSAVTCDSSPLCTIVEVGSQDFAHTYQSTRGGSGGPVLQKAAGSETWSIVGMNEGAESSGQVSKNVGLRIESAP